MKNKSTMPEEDRVVSSGGGVVIAALMGFVGIATGVILWRAGAHPLVALLVYLTAPAAILGMVYLLSRRRVRARRAKAKHEKLQMPGKSEHGQV